MNCRVQIRDDNSGSVTLSGKKGPDQQHYLKQCRSCTSSYVLGIDSKTYSIKPKPGNFERWNFLIPPYSVCQRCTYLIRFNLTVHICSLLYVQYCKGVDLRGGGGLGLSIKGIRGKRWRENREILTGKGAVKVDIFVSRRVKKKTR
jgi:hypothetical protein